MTPEREQQIRDAKLADSLLLTAAEFRERAKDQPDCALVFESCAAHVEAQVDAYRSAASDPFGPNWEQVAHKLARGLRGEIKPETALRDYRKQAGLT